MVQSPEFPPSDPDVTPQGGHPWPYAIVDLVAGGLDPDVDAPPQTIQQWPSTRFKLTVATSFLALLGGLGGIVWGGQLLQQTLRHRTIPLVQRVEATIEASLGRSIQWGDLERLSLTGVRIGKTVIPPSATETASVTIEAIDITPNWGGLMARGTLKPTITLVQPHLSLVQSQDGHWLALPLPQIGPTPTPGEPTTLPIGAIQLQDATLTVATQIQDPQAVTPRAPVQVDNLDGQVVFLGSGQGIRFDVQGRVDQGRVQIAGRADPAAGSIQANLQIRRLPLTGVNLLLPSLVGLRSGILDSQLSLVLPWPLSPESAPIDLKGTVQLAQGQIELGHAPVSLSDLHGTLTWRGQQARLSRAGLRLGDLALQAEGVIDRQKGYALTAQTPALTAAAIQSLTAVDLSEATDRQFQLQARVTGALGEPELKLQLQPQPPGSSASLGLNGEAMALKLGLEMLGLPSRQPISLIEGATYAFRDTGAWITLSDGTVIPPLSAAAYAQAQRQFQSAIRPALDRKFFWLLQTNPYAAAIAADLGQGRLRTYLEGSTFNTDRFFLEYFLPVYSESSRAAGLDPGESLWMLDHSLRTLQDPLLRAADATPIIAGSGIVGSFWQNEQALSLKQLILRPFLAQAGGLGDWVRWGLLQELTLSTSIDNRRLSSSPEVMSKLPNVTYGAEEGAMAQALGIVQFQGAGVYSQPVQTLAAAIVQNEQAKQQRRRAITATLHQLATDHGQAIGDCLASFNQNDWAAIGLGPQLQPAEAADLTGGNILSVLVSRNQKAGYPLPQAYGNSRALWLDWLQHRQELSQPDQLIFAFLKDYAFRAKFWSLLIRDLPYLTPQVDGLIDDLNAYRQLAQVGATLQEQLYQAMVADQQDIGISPTIKQAIGFQAHLDRLLDQALQPADPGDPRYQAFRRSLAIYLREAPDISVYGGTPASLRLYGLETLNVQELVAVDPADAPRIQAFARLYQAARQTGLIQEWDIPGFERILLTGSLLAAGVERQDLPPALAQVGFPSDQFRRDLLLAVGPEGIKVEATRLGVQAHDHRVSFQPVTIPDYRPPAFEVTNPQACPRQPRIQAIALGPQARFVWNPVHQRVELDRAGVACPLEADWTSLFFDTLLESVPVVQSEAGAAQLQAQLRQAQLLEAGLF